MANSFGLACYTVTRVSQNVRNERLIKLAALHVFRRGLRSNGFGSAYSEIEPTDHGEKRHLYTVIRAYTYLRRRCWRSNREIRMRLSRVNRIIGLVARNDRKTNPNPTTIHNGRWRKPFFGITLVHLYIYICSCV